MPSAITRTAIETPRLLRIVSSRAGAGRGGWHEGAGVSGVASFRRQESLEQCLEEARAQVEYAKQQKSGTDRALNARQKAAHERVARERKARVEAALEQLPDAQKAKKRNGAEKEDARPFTSRACVLSRLDQVRGDVFRGRRRSRSPARAH